MPIENGLYYFLQHQEGNLYPPLVLIHGSGGSHLSWPSELRRLPGQDVYALDLPGHGKSAGHGEQTLAAYADQTAAWMDALKLYRAVFVGHSLGGGVALEMALRHPHRVAGLVLIGSGARLPVPDDLLEYAANPATFPTALELLRARAFSPQTPPRLVELAMQRLAEVRPSVLCNDFLACQAFDAGERLEKIRRPTLVVCGSDDRLAPLRQSQFLASQIEGARLRVVPEAGHMVVLEKPHEVEALVAEFIREERRRF